MTRDTTTGSHFENIVESVIKRSCEKYNLIANPQVFVGYKPGGGRHKIDWEIIDKNDENIRGLISCKTQNTSGTAEEKLVYEVIKLLHAMKIDSRYRHSWIVLGGVGWSHSMKNFIEKDLQKWIPECKEKITIYLSTDSLLTHEIKLR